MTKSKTTKRALLSSCVALMLCFSMLLGTTYAWFTDTAVSANNKIVAGNLDVKLYLWTKTEGAGEATKTEITKESAPIFGGDSDNCLAPMDTPWEPNKTQVVYLSIENAGTLDLKYKVAIDVKNTAKDLYEAMQYAITPDAKYGEVTAWDSANGKDVSVGINDTGANDVVLKKGEEHFFALSVHMDENAGNEYMNGQVDFDIRVLAGQLASELDSFGSDYDKLAAYPGAGFVEVNPGSNVTAYEVPVRNAEDAKVGTAVVPADAVASNAKTISVNIDDTVYEGNITVADGETAKSFEISVEGLKENNDVPVKISLRIAAGLAPDTVKLYHYDDEIDCEYNPHTGYVTFESTTFSPFTVVYDAESEYVPPVIEDDTNYPTATVKYESQYVNTELPWGSYGQWSPTEGLNAKLEAAFTFACPDYENANEDVKAVIDAYRYWYCDFFVSLDKNLGKNEIFLGGNYGDFGWVGFHNGDLTLAAGTELPLLSSVTTNPWTYNDVETIVGEFICGVGDVKDALDDATFTVKLRLIDPTEVDTNEAEWWTTMEEDDYIDVNVVTYTFGGNAVVDGETIVTTAQGLQEAIDSGATNIGLGGDIDLNGPIVIPGN